ncbi:MAG: fused MFS/spermidine synthase, partial [Candidatus Sumerlaeota bacterium]|nr:fused MFS/spermidine synthase [Candidatus Sumerlaeota bacterium]
LLGGPNRPPATLASAPSPRPAAPEAEPEPIASPAGVRVALLGIALSGVAAMIYQVCWTRMFALLIGSSTYAFSLVVMVNIGGLALGGILFGRMIDRARRPMLVFAMGQLGVAVSAFLVAFFSKHYPVIILRLLARNAGDFPMILLNEFATLGFLLIVPTLLMGGMFPIVARICAGRVSRLGTTIGTVYAVNTIGAVVGSFSAALILMRYFGGIGPTMMIAVGLNLATAFVAVVAESRPPVALRWAALILVGLAGAGIAIAGPRWERAVMSAAPFMSERFDLERATHEADFLARARGSDLRFYEDGVVCTVTVRKQKGPLDGISLAVNGKVEASNTMGDMPTQLLCGHLGLLLRPEAKRAMIIGLGGGVSLSSILHHDSVESVDLIEISESVVRAVRQEFAQINQRALDDPRVHLTIADGRNHVYLTDKTYDLIVNVPSNPWMAGVSNLFTREFFSMCRERLNPDGVMMQWIHTYNMSFDDYLMVVRTFMEVMPHATLWEPTEGDYLMIGSKQPIQVDWNRLKAEIETPKVKEHLDWAKLGDIRVFVTDFMGQKEDLAQSPDYQKASINIDDTCRLEWSAPRAYYEARIEPDRLVALRHSPATLFTPDSLTPEVRQQLDRIPLARQTDLQGLQGLTRGDLLPGVKDSERAIELSPYDPIVRAHAVTLYSQLASLSVASGDLKMGLEWTRKALDTYEALGFAQEPFKIAELYKRCQELAAGLGDAALAAKCRGKILELGGEALEKELAGLTLRKIPAPE